MWPTTTRTFVLLLLICLVLAAFAPVNRPVNLLLAAFSSATSNAGNSFAASSSFLTYPQAVRADHPSVYYRGDDADGVSSATDSSGNGTTGGYLSVVRSFQVPGSPAGGSGAGADAAVFFDGDSSTANSPSLSVPDAFTYEIWFKTTSTAGGRIMAFGNASSGYSDTIDKYVTMTSAGGLTMTVGSSTISSSVTGLNNDAWHLLSASLGAAGMRLYVDGAEVAAAAGTTAGIAAFTGYLRLGGDGSYFVGTLDESVLYVKQLSAARISAHYTAGVNATSLATYTSALTTDSPWAIYHLNDAPGTSYRGLQFQTRLLDAGASNRRGWYSYVKPKGVTGGRPGALIGAEAASTSIGFEGSGIGYSPTQINNPTTFSLEVWFRTTATTGGDLFSFGNSMSGDTTVYDRIWKMMDDGTLTFGIYSGGAIVSATTTAVFNDGAWHHGVLTLSPATGMVMYVDAVVVATNPSPGNPQNYSGYWRWAGGKKWTTPPASEYFYGNLDEVAIYPTRLTAEQVARHYWTNT